jgi:hypothetical protein
MIFPVTIDANRGPSVLVGIVKELDSSLEYKPDEYVSGGPTIAAIDGQRLAEHMFDQVQFPEFLKYPPPALPRGWVRTPDRCKGEDSFGRDQPIWVLRDYGRKFAQEQQRQLDRDAA